MTDEEREAEIGLLRWEMTEAQRVGDISRARVVWEQLRQAIKGRSPERVERMEVAKGLR